MSSGGVGKTHDLTYYRAQFSHVINDKVQASLDLGFVDIDAPGFDSGVALQGGLSHKLNIELPAEIGTELQVKGYYTFIDDVDVFGGSIGAYGSYDLNVVPKIDFKAYAGLSLHYQDIGYSAAFLRDSQDVFPGITLGLRADINSSWSIESSVSHVDEPILMLGTRISF